VGDDKEAGVLNFASDGALLGARAAGDLDVVVVDRLICAVGHGCELDSEILGAGEPVSGNGSGSEFVPKALLWVMVSSPCWIEMQVLSAFSRLPFCLTATEACHSWLG
jgi:hypothetical protein